MFRMDVRRAICSWRFLAAALGMAIFVICGALSEAVSVLKSSVSPLIYYHQTLLLNALTSNGVLMAMPVLAVLPYAASVVEDMESGYLKSLLPKTNITSYIRARGLTCAISGGLALACGILMAYGLFALVFSPLEVYGDIAVEFHLGEILKKLLSFFLMGALCAETGLLLGTLSRNRYVGYAAPFILTYVLIILQERYFRDTFLLNPKNYVTLQGTFPLDGWSAHLMLVFLFVAVFLAFVLAADRLLRDEASTNRPRPRHRRGQTAEQDAAGSGGGESEPPVAGDTSSVGFAGRGRQGTQGAHATGRASHFLQPWTVVAYNFRTWRGNARIPLTFALTFILCFLLSDKAANFAYSMGTIMQAFEPFIWTFGDANSVLLISLLLVLLFADLPNLSAVTPYYLCRMRRSTWVLGQVIYVVLVTLLYMLFIFLSTSVICMQNTFIGNQWSETAAILGYSGAGKAVALPAFVKVLELSRPYGCAATVFLLMLLYMLVLALVMLYFNLRVSRSAGIVAAFAFSLYGFLLNPQLFQNLFSLPEELIYKANVAVGWLSPLNHATYYMHNFGYDLLPKLWQTYAIFGALIVALFLLVLRAVRRYNFEFTGTEQSS